MFRISSLVLLIVLSSVRGLNLFSQELSHQVLVPAGNVVSAGNINYSQTVGETAVEFMTGTGYDFTQGFQQPGIIFDPGRLVQGNGVEVYPNPVTDNMVIKLFGNVARNFKIEILNLTGAVVYSGQLYFTNNYYFEKVIPVSNYSNGIYFVRVISNDKAINRTFKIEKL